MNSLIIIGMIILSFISYTHVAFAGWMQDQFNKLQSSNIESLKQTPLSQTKIGDGLKEALKVGIDNAIKLTAKTDGFFKNEEIKIPLPEKLQMLDKGLRMVGLGKTVDDFILSMNRAAEASAPQARDIFINSIVGLSFDDAMRIYNGGNTAATEFLKEKTSHQLRDAFLPFIRKSLAQYDVTAKYNDVIGKYRSLPFSHNVPIPDVEQYVLDKALNGLFLILGQEETKIRTQPAARITSLLKEVFK
ncbi:MAG: DUF4197 domain-containing protein [Candidatus Omnitrophica bacterium]|nr:DUF4197 domain-containing protein [Candidatus Omnitrophota bacterium]